MEVMDILLSLLALIVLEVVLGIDNLVLLSVLTEKLPREKRKKARRLGLTFAWVTRLILLACAVWLSRLTAPVVTISDLAFSARDIFLIAGGLFLIGKATQEIHSEIAIHDVSSFQEKQSAPSMNWVLVQVAVMDVVFSLDSVLTAIGLTQIFWIMALAITIAILVMIFASEPVSAFIEKHPTIKMLALSFLMLIGTVLIADGLSFHIPRGYIYFVMAYSLGIEALNGLRRSRQRS